MLDYNFLVIVAVVLASQVLAIWAIYLIVRRGYSREVADLEAQVATLNKRLQTLGQQPTGVPMGLLLLMLLAMAFVLLWFVLFQRGDGKQEQHQQFTKNDAYPNPPDPPPATPHENLHIVGEHRYYYQCCCPPYYSHYRYYDYYW